MWLFLYTYYPYSFRATIVSFLGALLRYGGITLIAATVLFGFLSYVLPGAALIGIGCILHPLAEYLAKKSL